MEIFRYSSQIFELFFRTLWRTYLNIYLCFSPFLKCIDSLFIIIADIMKDWIGEDSYENPFEWQHLGLNIFVLSLQTFLFHLLNISLEYKWLQSLFRYVHNIFGGKLLCKNHLTLDSFHRI